MNLDNIVKQNENTNDDVDRCKECELLLKTNVVEKSGVVYLVLYCNNTECKEYKKERRVRI